MTDKIAPEDNLLQETTPDMLARLGTDGGKWAAEFVKQLQSTRALATRDGDLDEGMVIAWFANAIEAGRSAGQDGEMNRGKARALDIADLMSWDNVDVSDLSKCLAVLIEGYDERTYQANKWANGEVAALNNNDDKRIMIPEQWTAYITNYLGSWIKGKFPPYNVETVHAFRKNMIKVMMLALGAVLWTDRRLRDMASQENWVRHGRALLPGEQARDSDSEYARKVTRAPIGGLDENATMNLSVGHGEKMVGQ